MGKPGGTGICQTDANGAADQLRAGSTTDKTGMNCQTSGDCRVEVSMNQIIHTLIDRYVEVKGAKGETKIGGFLELAVGIKHSMTLGLKTAIDLSYSKTFDLGPYSTEMLAMKYEVIHRKMEKVGGEKRDDYSAFKYEKNKGPWKKTIAGKKKSLQPIEKEMSDALMEKAGAVIETTAAKYKARAKDVKERIGNLNVKISKELQMQCSNARIKFMDFNCHISQMEYQCGKWERKCKAMEEAVSALAEFKGSKRADKAASLKLKGAFLKFTGSVVKLGE